MQWHYDRVATTPEALFSAYVMPQYEHIHNTAIPILRRVLGSYGLEESIDYDIVGSPFPKCVFSGTSQEIHFLSASRPDKFKSVEYSHATMDEPGLCKREAFQRLRERVRAKIRQPNQMLLIGTPEGITWYAEAFDSDSLEGWIKVTNLDHYIDNETPGAAPVRYRRFRLTTYDNEMFLPDDYITNLLDSYRGNPAYVQAYIEGRFVPLTTGGCYTNYMPRLHDNPKDVEPDAALEIDLTWDFNADPLAWVALQERTTEEHGERTRRRHVIHEANLNRGLLDDACIEFAVKHPVHTFGQTPIVIYGDSSGHASSHKIRGSDYQEIKRLLNEIGFRRVEVRALRRNPLEVDTVNALNRAFLDDQLRVNPRCSRLRQSLLATKWKDGERRIDKPSGEKHTHHSDALKYAIYAIAEGAGRMVKSFKY